ncbi:MAG: hypothetical protein HKN85_06645 [Gammaproteobacteria bacterium]|nr:hypothetical protein [Gammaproteobacteria bacterium]
MILIKDTTIDPAKSCIYIRSFDQSGMRDIEILVIIWSSVFLNSILSDKYPTLAGGRVLDLWLTAV